MRQFVVVTLQFEGLHYWPKAPTEVGFLRSPHRHVFHIKCWKEVTHGDREIEIITLKQTITGGLNSLFPGGNMLTNSCEQLAATLIRGYGLHACEVLEDGENGAYVEA
jgi:hypothetical protein